MITRIAVVFVCLLSVVGCDVSRLTHRAEWECLESERLKFKDPDSIVFVANLGNRGLPKNEEQFWVRYKAKNSYGAYVQGNMLCHKSFDWRKKWVRDDIYESTLKIRIETKLLRENNEAYEKGGQLLSRYEIDRMAEEIFSSPEDLDQYI